MSLLNSLFTYNEDPKVYIMAMHSMSGVSLILFLLGAYCVIKKKKSVSLSYRKLIILYMTVNICSQLCWTSFYLPHLMLPYTAGNTLGLFRLLGVPPELQVTIQFSLLAALGGTTVLMFAYRYYIILPPGSLLKSRRYSRLYLASVFVGSVVLPPPLIAWSCYSSNSERVKDNLVRKFGLVTQQLFDEQTLAFEMTVGSSLFLTTVYLTICVCLMGFNIIWLVGRISVIFSTYSSALSGTVKKEHRSLTKMLYVQTAVTFGLISLPFTAFSVFMWFGIPACGILEICFVVYSLADPSSTVIMICMHHPYKSAVQELFIFLGMLKAPMSVPVYSTSFRSRTSKCGSRRGPYWNILKDGGSFSGRQSVP